MCVIPNEFIEYMFHNTTSWAVITDLANKAAADAGIEYTYRDTYTELYPAYPINPLKQPDSADAGYTIFTLRFAVPREMKTRDEVVHQIVQIAFPTGATAIATVETILNRYRDWETEKQIGRAHV